MIIESVTISNQEPEINQEIHVEVKIKNVGQDNISESFYVDFYFDHSGPPSVGEYGDLFVEVFGLNAGLSEVVDFGWVSNSNPEEWESWFQVDTDNEIQETNEGNNVRGPEEIRWHESETRNNYSWPIAQQNDDHPINSVLDEARPLYFHDGLDINAPRNTDVYSISSGTFYWATDGVHVGNFWYIHLEGYYYQNLPNEQGQWIISDGVKLAQTDSENNVHLGDGPDQSEINPLRSDGITPHYSDSYDPTIGDLTIRSDPGGEIIASTQVNGQVDFIVEVKDQVWSSILREGIYKLGYRIKTRPGGVVKEEHFNFHFDNWLSSSNYEHVYYGGQQPSYPNPFNYIPTNLMTDNWYWDSNGQVDGDYWVCIIAEDKSGRIEEKCFEITVTSSSLIKIMGEY